MGILLEEFGRLNLKPILINRKAVNMSIQQSDRPFEIAMAQIVKQSLMIRGDAREIMFVGTGQE